MRLVAWNCMMGTDRKIPHMLAELTPDLAVVPESAECPSVTVPSLLGDAVPHAWTGRWPNKGLGILAPSAKSLTVLPPDAPTDAGNALAVRVEVDGLDVDGVGGLDRAFRRKANEPVPAGCKRHPRCPRAVTGSTRGVTGSAGRGAWRGRACRGPGGDDRRIDLHRVGRMLSGPRTVSLWVQYRGWLARGLPPCESSVASSQH